MGKIAGLKKITFCLLLLVLNNFNLLANGGQAFAFLKNGVGVKATSMGGSFVGISDDVSAIYYNPAGLLLIKDLELSFETYVLSFGRNLNYIALAKPFELNKNKYSSGVSWINYSSGNDIEERKTNSYEPEGRFSNNANIFTFGLAIPLIENLLVGGNFKILFQNIKDIKGTGVGFDFGVLFNIFRNFSGGFTFQNISTNVNWTNTSFIENIEQYFLCGFSYKEEKIFSTYIDLQVAIDFVYLNTDFFKIKAGSEIFLNNFFAVRIGYNETFSFGIGMKVEPSEIFSIKIDYCCVNDKILNEEFNHRFGITFDYVVPHWKIEDKRTNIK